MENIRDKLDGNQLDLSFCELKNVPTKEIVRLQRATRIDLSCNFITSLPDDFCKLNSVVELNLSKNQLTTLPTSVGGWQNLKQLDLLGNQIVSLPLEFATLNKLVWLDLKGNPLEPGLREAAGDCLDEKECRACAKNVIAYLRKLQSDLDRKKNDESKKQKEQERLRLAEERKVKEEAKKEKLEEKERRRLAYQEKAQVTKRSVSNGVHDEVESEPKSTVRKERVKSGSTWCGRLFSISLFLFVLLSAVVIGLVFHCDKQAAHADCQVCHLFNASVRPHVDTLWRHMSPYITQVLDRIQSK